MEQKQIISELNVIKKHSHQMQIQYNVLQAEYESEMKTFAQKLESYDDKYLTTEQKLFKAQQKIEELESNLVILTEDNEQKIKDIQGV